MAEVLWCGLIAGLKGYKFLPRLLKRKIYIQKMQSYVRCKKESRPPSKPRSEFK